MGLYAFFILALLTVATPTKADGDAIRCVQEELRAYSRNPGALAIREAYIQRNLQLRISTPQQNEAWITTAESTATGSGTRFLESENAALKNLNDTYGNKNLVTAMTQRYQQLLLENFHAYLVRHPEIQAQVYSDFKSVRVAFRGPLDPNVDVTLRQLTALSQRQWIHELRDSNLVRGDDHPEQWIRSGIADTADGASLAARMARETSGVDSVLPLTGRALRTASARLAEVERSRTKLEASFGGTALMEGIPGKRVPSLQVFEALRKADTPEELVQALALKFPGAPRIDVAGAGELMRYADAIDLFMPSLRIAHREVVNLNDAPHGGFSADFAGLGARNLSATASALAGQSRVESAIAASRLGEQEVTKAFRRRLQAFKTAVGEIARCSGDDCFGVATRPLSSSDKLALLSRLASAPETQGVRIAFVGSEVQAASDRTLLAVHGEIIEKELRQALASQIAPARLAELVFGVDMQGSALGRGAVRVLTGAPPGAPVSEAEALSIHLALESAVRAINGVLGPDGTPAAYTVGR